MNTHMKNYHRSDYRQYLVKPLYSLSNFTFNEHILLTIGPMLGSEQILLFQDSNAPISARYPELTRVFQDTGGQRRRQAAALLSASIKH